MNISRKRELSIVLVGAGAIGTVYADKLSQKEIHRDNGIRINFRIAADRSRVRRYRENGIEFQGRKLNTDFFTPTSRSRKADIILVAVKNYSLDNALDVIAPLVGGKTAIISLLNGISSEGIIAERFSPENVLYGYYLGHTATRKDNNTMQDGQYMTAVGDYPVRADGSISKMLSFAADTLSSLGINIEIHMDMKTDIWKKFAVNVCLNQSTAFFNCTYGEILKDRRKMSFFRSLASEIQEISIHENIRTSESIASYVEDILRSMSPEDRSSMAQDVMMGRRTEVDSFAGEVLRLAKKHHIDVPANSMVMEKFHLDSD